MTNQSPLVFSQVHKTYGTFTLNLSVTIPRGLITGFIGANGAGKTTAIRLALGLAHPDSGTVQLLDRSRVGVVFDTPCFPGDMTVDL